MESTGALSAHSHGVAVADDAAIAARGVHKIYRTRGGTVEAVRGADFEVERKEFVSLVGPSGCGKSTLLKIAAGLVPYEAGRVEVLGAPPREGREDVGIMLQSPVLLPWRTVLKNVLLPIEIYGGDVRAARARAEELLVLVGLEGFEDKHAWELSGGMQQRASLARLLVLDPAILLMDEPFSAVDEFTREKLTLELARLHTDLRRSTLYVTHNIGEAVLLSDRVVVMKARPGEIIGIVDVDLPRPRSQATLDDPRTGAIVSRIRGMFQSDREEADE